MTTNLKLLGIVFSISLSSLISSFSGLDNVDIPVPKGPPSHSYTTYSSSAWNSVNNYNQSVDYKDYTFEEDRQVAISATSKVKYDDSLNSEPIKDNKDLGVELSYLINNDIISRKSSIYIPQLESSNSKRVEPPLDDVFYKSDLYMALYKSKFGVIESRYARFNKPSVRGGSILTGIIRDYYGTYYDEYNNVIFHYNGDFTKGDFWLYTSPNVYELYLHELLNKGIIIRSELDGKSGLKTINDYNALTTGGVKPKWWTALGQAKADSLSTVLGYSYTYDGTVLSQSNPKYFAKEKMYTLDAFSIIEEFLRATEKEMTHMEASIINYKYGINYLNDLDEAEKSTVEFLIAKGILNFEEPSEFINFYGEFTNEIAYKILYRVANPEARHTFSDITLTDSQSYWKERGFLEENIKIHAVSEVPNIFGVQDPIENQEGDFSIFEMMKNFTGIKVNASTVSIGSTYTVKMNFTSSSNYYYRGISIAKLHADNSLDSTVVSSKKTQVVVNGEKIDSYAFTFAINSSSQDHAFNYVNGSISYDIGQGSGSIKGVTTVEKDGNITTLVPKSLLKSTWTEIEVIQDKVLQNKKTGVTAILLPEKGYALIGGQVIVSSLLIETISNGEVYYNLDVIAGLLSNSVLVKLGNGNIIYSLDNINEYPYSIKSSVNTNKGEVNAVRLRTSSNEIYTYAKAVDIGQHMNLVYREFNYKNNTAKITMFVEWIFTLPEDESFITDSWHKDIKSIPTTLHDINSLMYTRPSDLLLLQDWWDSNYGMSNALANFIYGTESIEYIKSGYLIPSVKICIDGYSGSPDTILQDFFETYNFTLTNYGNINYQKFVNGTTYEFWNTYYKKYRYGNPSLEALASTHRTFEVYTPTPVKTSTGTTVGKSYSNKIFISNANVSYIEVGNRREQISVDPENFIIRFKDKTSIKEFSIGTRVLYRPTNTLWIYCGTTENGYIKLLPDFTEFKSAMTIGYPAYKKDDSWKPIVTIGTSTDPLIDKLYSLFTPADKDKYKVISQDRINLMLHGYKTLEELYTDDMNIRQNTYYNKYFPIMEYFPNVARSIKDIYGVSTYQTMLQDGYNYLGDGGIYEYKKGELRKLSQAEMFDEKVMKSSVVGIPYFYLPSGSFRISDSKDAKTKANLLIDGATINALTYINPVMSTIGSMVTDKIISQSIGTVQFKDIPQGSTVSFADISWTKNGEYLDSIIEEPSLAGYIKSNISKDIKIHNRIRKLFTSYAITTDNYIISLDAYIDEFRVGNSLNTLIDTGILYRDGVNYYVYSNHENKDISTASTHLSVRIKPSELLQFRSLGADNNKFTLLYYASIAVMNITQDIPFFSENLDYDISFKDEYDVNSTEFVSSVQSEYVKEVFNRSYNRSLMYRIKYVSAVIIMIVGLYLSIFSWMIKLVTSIPMLNNILYILEMKREQSRHGLDFVAIFSFGIYRLDSNISYVKTILISFLSFAIAYGARQFM